jgi:hypothetical protein
VRNARGVGQQVVQRDPGPLRRPAGQPAVYGVVQGQPAGFGQEKGGRRGELLAHRAELEAGRRGARRTGRRVSPCVGGARGQLRHYRPASGHHGHAAQVHGSSLSGGAAVLRSIATDGDLTSPVHPLATTAPAAGESFRTVRAARFAEVLRGVSFTPAR